MKNLLLSEIYIVRIICSYRKYQTYVRSTLQGTSFGTEEDIFKIQLYVVVDSWHFEWIVCKL